MYQTEAFGIDINVVTNKENEFAWMRHLLSTNPHPILRVEKDGTVVYANEACFPLLEIWGINTGEKLPSKILFFVRKAILEKGIWNIETKGSDREYLLTFKSAGDGYIYIYGFDLSSLKLREKPLYIKKTKQRAFKEPRKIIPPFSDLKTLLNQVAEIVASTLKVESCIILKTSQGKADFPDSLPSEWNKGQSTQNRDFISQLNESPVSETSLQCFKPYFEEEICNGKYFQEIGSNGRELHIPHEFAGGISVFTKRNGKTFAVITLQKVKPAEFARENLCFLRYVLSLVIRIIECQEIDRKLKDRIHFFETLLHSVPDPTYFRDISDRTEDYNFIINEIAEFSKENPAGHPMLEIEKVIQGEFTATSKKKGEEISKDDIGLIEVIQDISGLKESEKTLKMALEVQKVLWTVINNSPAVVFLWRNEENWPADFVSENVSQFGYTVEDFTSGKFLYGDIIHREDRNRVLTELEHCIKTGYEGFRTEYRIYTKDGELRWVDERAFIQRNKAGKATYFQGVVIDITERKIAEEAFEKAEYLRKKEINHRIKNNLQIVSSLLDLQAEKFSDRKVIEAFKESESRVLSMSLIHQELYESGKLDSLDFSSYLRKLIADILRSYRTENCKIQVNLDVSSIFIGVDTAVALGIIINELFTNSLKYAFPAGSCGEIRIALFREGNKEKKNENEVSNETFSARNPGLKSFLPDSKTYEPLMLVFADNGRGFPEKIDFRNPETLGLQLVNALVEQIEGNINLERGKGTRFTIKFKGEIQESS